MAARPATAPEAAAERGGVDPPWDKWPAIGRNTGQAYSIHTKAKHKFSVGHDLDDFVLWAAAMAGPDLPASNPATDLDGDGDLQDFSLVHKQFSGPM